MLIILASIVILLGLTYLFLIWNFNYWTNRGIISANTQLFLRYYPIYYKEKRRMIDDLDEIYRTYKDKEDFVGMYNIRSPQLFILNPKLCQRILTCDFKHFQDNEFSTMVDKSSDAMAANNPFSLTGKEWEKSRSSIKDGLETETVETTYNAIWQACKKMRIRIEELNKTSSQEGIKTKDLFLHFTSEVITDCVFGFNFCGQPSTQLVFDAILNTFDNRLDIQLYYLLTQLVPSIKKFYKARFLPQRVTILFQKLMQTAIDLRKSNAAHKNRRDFLNHLLDLQKRQNLSTQEMTTHAMSFIMHGLLSIYTILTHCVLLLAKNPKVQERLRYEILQHLKKNRAKDYNNIAKMPFLEACVYETIRILPPAAFVSKICTEPILLLNKSGRTLKLEKGEIVILPLYSIMNDENFYSQAKEFQPERFIESNGSFSDDFHKKGLYYAFGAGPRECVGKRFALTQIKAALIEIFSNFKIRVNPKTKASIDYDPKFSMLRFSDEIYLDFEIIS